MTEADRKVTEAVHRHDTRIFAQTNHFGVNSPTDGIDELHELISASDVPAPTHGKVPRPMEEADMVALEEHWARAAELIREGGYDGVEILMAHGYLLHQFFSPLYNHRTDEYGVGSSRGPGAGSPAACCGRSASVSGPTSPSASA